MTDEEKMKYTYFIEDNNYLDYQQRTAVNWLSSKYQLSEKHKNLINYSVYKQNKLKLLNLTIVSIEEAIKKIYNVIESLGCLTDDVSVASMFNNPSFGAMHIRMLPILSNQIEVLNELKKDISNGKNLQVANIDKLAEKYSSKDMNKDFILKLGKQANRKYPTILAILLIKELENLTGKQSKANPIKKNIKNFIEKLFEIKLRDADFTKDKDEAIISQTPPYIFYYKKR